ncbi:MAG: FAD:protein FMN transferase [Synergistaceae bacterium]|jgi:thiamine biosynthesis lipoprotein|nr:FAD:protein FMN transferase [Synergistaceae bacterium]
MKRRLGAPSPVALFALSAVFIMIAAFLAFVVPARNRGVPARSAGESSEEYRKFSSDSFDSFDTLVTFTAFARDEAEFERYSKIVHDEMNRLHKLFDIYGDYEGIPNMKTINDMAGLAPVEIDQSVIEFLGLAIDAYDFTDGAVNVALGPVLSIWHDCREKALAEGNDVVALPSVGELRAAAVHISPEDISIDRGRSSVFLPYGDMSLDVGAMAKGYASQRAAELAMESGLRSGIINAGGNVVVIGRPLDGRNAWNIGVHSPSEEGDLSKFIDVLSLDGGAAVTSGSDQRYFTADGRRYHHIINPATLFPAEGVKSVTVLHIDSTTADILSTAAFILPIHKAHELIARHGAEAMWVTESGRTLATKGYLSLSKTGAGEMVANSSDEPDKEYVVQ